MLFILWMYQVRSYDFTNEAYRTLYPSDSPFTCSIQKGLALMMVNWGDAAMKMSIPNALRTPVRITSDDGYSLFTFKDPAEITMTFSTSISFYIASCPQKSSKNGAIQYLYNGNSAKFTLSKLSKDVYFSSCSPYSLTGSIDSGTFSSDPTVYYWDTAGKAYSTKEVANLNLENLRYTTEVIRFSFTDSFDLSLNLKATTANPTYSAFLSLYWTAVVEKNNNFLSNAAYLGSISEQGTNKSKLISAFPPFVEEYYIVITNRITSAIPNAVLTMKFPGINEQVIFSGATQTYKVAEAYSADIFIQTQYCTKQLLKTITAKTSKTPEIITDSDLPSSCKTPKYSVCLIPKVASPNTLGYKKGSSLIVPFSSKITLEETSSFTVDLYLMTSSSCEEVVKLNTYTATTNFACQTISSLPSNCTYTGYRILRTYSFSSKYKLGYKLNDEDAMETFGNSGSYARSSNQQFFIGLYLIQSPKCSQTKIADIQGSLTDKWTAWDDRIVPEHCRDDTPTSQPTSKPTSQPTSQPTSKPTSQPTYFPPSIPTFAPTSEQPVEQNRICISNYATQDSEISYTLSYESFKQTHVFKGQILTMSSNKAFSAKFYLTKSPICQKVSFITEVFSDYLLTCDDHFTQLLLPTDPSQCTDADVTPGEKSGDSSNTLIYIIAAVIGVLVIGVIIVIIIIVVRKRKKMGNNFQSETLSSTLLNQ